jgi:hypothetical protein
MNQTQDTIQKIEESLARQNYSYPKEDDLWAKVVRFVWIALGILLFIITFITVIGWLTIEEGGSNIAPVVISK